MNSICNNDDPQADQEIRMSFQQFFQQNLSNQQQQALGQHSFQMKSDLLGENIGIGGGNGKFSSIGDVINVGSIDSVSGGNGMSGNNYGGGASLLSGHSQLENMIASPEHFNNLVDLDLLQHAAATAASSASSASSSLLLRGKLGCASPDPIPPQRTSSAGLGHNNRRSGLGGSYMLDSGSQHESQSSHRNSSQVSVNHDYTDYANVPEEDQELPPEVDANNNLRKRNTGGVISPFPERLHDMLSKTNMPEVVSWAPHGRCFLVRKPKEFESKVMPLYFNHTKLTSFQRQLNLYGFKRITKGADRGAYYHELFLRGRPKLCTRMRRQKVKGTGQKPLPDPDNEPNFYAMKSVEDTPAGGASSLSSSLHGVNSSLIGSQGADILRNNSLESDGFMGSMSESPEILSAGNVQVKAPSAITSSLFGQQGAPRRAVSVPYPGNQNCSVGQLSGSLNSVTSMPPLNVRSSSDDPFIQGGEDKNNVHPVTSTRDLGGMHIELDSFESNIESSKHQNDSLLRLDSGSARPGGIVGSSDLDSSATLLQDSQKKSKKSLHATVKKALSKLTGLKKDKSRLDIGDKNEIALDSKPAAQAESALSPGNSASGAVGHGNIQSNRTGRPRRSSLLDKSTPRDRRESVKFHPEELWFGTRNERRRSIQQMAIEQDTRHTVRRLSQNRLSITSIGSLSQSMSMSVGKQHAGGNSHGGNRRMSLMSFESFNFEDDAEMLQKRMSLVSIGSALADFKKDMERRSSKAHSDSGSCAWIDDRVLNRRHSLQHSIDFDGLFDDASQGSSNRQAIAEQDNKSTSPHGRPNMPPRHLSTREAAAAVAAEFSFDDDDDEIVSVG